jgi:hypothetical protein
MAKRLLYRATKEGERRMASPAGFGVPETLGSYRAPIKGGSYACTLTLALLEFEGQNAFEVGILGVRLRAKLRCSVVLSADVQDFPAATAGGAKYRAL